MFPPQSQTVAKLSW